MREAIPKIRVRTRNGTLLARDGVILCFFMHRSHEEVVPAVWRALQAYLRAIPPRAIGWYHSSSGEKLPFNEDGREYIRKKMLEPLQMDFCNVYLMGEDQGEIGGFHFEYNGRRLDAPTYVQDRDSTCAVSFTFPTEYLVENGPVHLRALSLELAQELPFSFGYASGAFISPGPIWQSMLYMLFDPLDRYLGMDVYYLNNTSRIIGTGARGAYWLTFLGQPLLGQLGGVERLRQELSFPEVSFHPLEGERLLIALGEWPDAIDTTQRPHVPHYRALARLLEPYLRDEDLGWGASEHRKMNQWLRRLCQ
jgi:hypothetical protein